MKDKMKDFGKVVQEAKPGGTDVKCAEIKPIPTGGSVFCEKQKNVFKIGEYNRATASFEMNSTEDLAGKDVKPKFDLSSDTGPCQYFKSSFARSMVISNSSKSKSLDCTFLNGDSSRFKNENGDAGRNGYGEALWMMPGKENWDLRRAQPAEVRDDESTTGSLTTERPPGLKKSDVIEEHLRNQSFFEERPGSRSGSAYQRHLPAVAERRPDDLLLRSPLTASCRSSFHRSCSSASDVDSVMLQCQVTTLQWQLRQAEASRQMYRAVMEQVVSFLQKTHKDLDVLQNRLEDSDGDSVTRVPRSRSVHAVDTSPTRHTCPRSETNLSFQKAKSFAQIGGDPDCPKHGAMFRESSWRRPRKQQQQQQQRTQEDVSPSKLSEEAFRLLRTVKSLLSTREPDLASRLSATCSSPATVADVSSASSTVSATLESDHSDHYALRGTPAKELPPPPQQDSRRRRSRDVDPKTSPPQLSVSSADDESGFSSLNSFQEIGLPLSSSSFVQANGRTKEGFEEVGLPRVEDPGCKVHRRWSSTPVEGHLSKLRPASLCTTGDVLRVLWV